MRIRHRASAIERNMTMISAVRIALAATIALIGLAGTAAAKPKCHQEGRHILKKLPNGTKQCFLVVHYVCDDGSRTFLGSVPVDRSKCGVTAR